MLLAALIVTLLPWGAMVHAAQTAPSRPPAVVAQEQPQAAASPLPAPCRRNALPGNVCRLDFAPEDDDALLPPPADTAERNGRERAFVAEWQGSIPIPPPRLN